LTLPSYAMNQASFPEMYERQLVAPLFRPFAELTLDELKVAPGDRALDIACGTGIVARLAIERQRGKGHVVGVDISKDMLAVARATEPRIDWREGNAEALPLREGERFDVVTCQQGPQFFADKPKAADEMRRALAKGGRIALAAWRSDEENPFLRELRQTAEQHLGAITDARYGYGDQGALKALLEGAGFADVSVKKVSRTIRFADGATFIRMNTMAFVGMSAAGKAMDDKKRSQAIESIISESAPTLRAHSDTSGLAFELSTNLATARG
jgi:ubiquinone/menaquinone biosynthesis C-methylase UbiE